MFFMKTGKLSINSKEDYSEKMEVHIKNDTVLRRNRRQLGRINFDKING